jgi:hypothetical protein
VSKYRGEMSLAFREYLLEGKSITRLEGVVFFGLASITKEISQLRKEGWTISSRKVPYPAVIRRINECAVFQPSPQVPVKEISMTEYWINE